MAVTIGNIAVAITAVTNGLRDGVNEGAGLLSTFGGIAGNITGVAGKVTAAISAVAGAGITLMIKDSLDAIDTMSKLASSMDTTVGQIAGLTHAADLSGVSVEDLTGALQRLTRNGKDIFEIADAMAAINDPSDLAKFAFDNLGKSGQKLIPLLAGGSAQLREMVEEGERLSGLKGVDAKQVEEANDAFTRVHASIKGIANTAAVALAPALEKVAVGLQNIVELGKRMAGDVARGITATAKATSVLVAITSGTTGQSQFGNIATGATMLATGLTTVKVEANGAAEGINKVAQAAANLEDDESMEKVEKATDQATTRMLKLRDEIDVLMAPEDLRDFVEITQELSDLRNLGAPEELISQINELLTQRKELVDQQKEEKRLQDELEDKRKQELKDQEALHKSMEDRAKQLLDEVKTPFDHLQDRIAEIQDLMAKGIINSGDAEKLKEFAQSEFNKAKELEDKANKPDRKEILDGPRFETRGSSDAFAAVLKTVKLGGGDRADPFVAATKEQTAVLNNTLKTGFKKFNLGTATA